MVDFGWDVLSPEGGCRRDGPCGYKVSVRIPQPRNGQIRSKLFPLNIIPKTMSK